VGVRFPKEFIQSGGLADARSLSGGDLRVWLVLLASADTNGNASLTQGEIAALAGIGRTTVRESLDRLCRTGMVERASRRGVRSTFEVGRSTGQMLVASPANPKYAESDKLVAPPANPAEKLVGPPANSPSKLVAPPANPYSDRLARTSNAAPKRDHFGEFYDIWPKKANRPAAQQAWATATKHANPAVIIAAAVRYRDNPGRPEHRYIPQPANWLKAEGWNDDLPDRRPTRTNGDAKAAAILELGRSMNAPQRKAIA
jgi:hypothetical protein